MSFLIWDRDKYWSLRRGRGNDDSGPSGGIVLESHSFSASYADTVIPAPDGVTTGDVLIAMYEGGGSVSIPGFTTIDEEEDNGAVLSLLYRVADGSEGNQFNATSDFVGFVTLMRFSGVDGASPISGVPVTKKSSGTSASFDIDAVTTDADNAMLIVAYAANKTGGTANPTAVIDFGDEVWSGNSYGDAVDAVFVDQLEAAGSSGGRVITLQAGTPSTINHMAIMAALRPAT